LTPRGRLRAALCGHAVVAFAPLAWARLPEFLHLARTSAFWLDVGTTQRLLGDAAVVCTADACLVPLLPRLRSPEASSVGASPAASAASPASASSVGASPAASAASPASASSVGASPAASAASPASASSSACAASPVGTDEIAALPEVTAAVSLLGRLASVGRTGLIAELPPLAELGSLLPDAAPEDLEDALADLVRAGVEAGAEAVVIRGADGQYADRQDVGRTVDAIAPLADFYGAKVLGVDAERGWAADNCCPVGLLGPDGRWPDLARGVVLTAGDVTDWWTPHDMRAVLRERQGSRQ